jgi:hypothetical protein
LPNFDNASAALTMRFCGLYLCLLDDVHRGTQLVAVEGHGRVPALCRPVERLGISFE